MARKYYISPQIDLAIPAYCDDYINSDHSIDSGLAEKCPICAYGSDKNLAGWTAYNISSNCPVTIEALEALLVDLKEMAFSENVNVSNNYQDGYLRETYDDVYTEWDDLSEEMHDRITQAINSTGSYMNLDDRGNGDYWLNPENVTNEYVSALEGMIEAIKAYEADKGLESDEA